MKIAFEWEILDEDTIRAKVIGGWIVYTSERDDMNAVGGAAMVFVPDVNHEWEVEAQASKSFWNN